METSSPAFSLVILILAGVFLLTAVAIYFSFGPPAKKLEEPWDRQED